MTYKVKESKILFLDSRSGQQINHKSRINFPTESFSASGNQLIRLTLLEFNLARTFYNINSTNNVFFIYDSDNPSTEIKITIAQGNYDGSTLATQIATDSNISACVFNSITEKFTFTLTGVGSLSYLYSKKIKGDPDNNYDTHDILGGVPTTSSTKVNMFGTVGLTQISRYPIQLQTINNILLKTNLQTNNFENNLNLDDSQLANVVNSHIFASIPVIRDTTTRMIRFVDSNSTFEMYIQNKHINNITFDIEDNYGRSIPALDELQYSSGNLSYNITVKYELLDPEVPPSLTPQFRGNYTNVITR
jgi:hypothetical protein